VRGPIPVIVAVVVGVWLAASGVDPHFDLGLSSAHGLHQIRHSKKTRTKQKPESTK